METSAEMQKILATIREFVEKEIIPLERLLLNHEYDALMQQMEEKRKAAKALGFWLPQIPRAYGGMGLTLVEHGMVSEALGRSILGHYALNCQAPDAGNMEILIEHGTPEQKEKYLMPLLAGDVRSCFSMTEPENPGSNPTWMSTTALKDGGEYVVTGNKWFSTGAEGAAFAIVMAITDPKAEKYKRASQIIVPADTPGFKLIRKTSVMGERGAGWLSHGEILYDGARVPLGNLLGAEGAGFAIAQERLGPGRIHHCMRWIGICERAFDLMCEQAVRREVAPGHPLAEQQTIQTWIAESRAEINSARLMTLDAAHKIDQQGQYAAREEVGLIKFHVAGILQRVLDRSLQTHGALGMTDETPLAFFFRHERAARIYDGPDEVHKRSVAQKILQKYQ